MTVDLGSAVHSLRQAREIAPSDTLLRPQADLLLGESLAWLGESKEAHEALQRALRGFQDLGATRDAAVAMSELSMVTWYVDGDRRSEELCDAALQMLAYDAPSPELVRVLETSAAVGARHFEGQRVIATTDQAIRLAASLGMDPPSRALVYRAMARCDIAEADALTDFREVLDRAVQSGSSGVGVMTQNYTNNALAYQGPRRAMAAIEEWRALAERRGDALAELAHRCQVPWCLFHTGEWQRALALAERLDEELEQKGMWLDLEDHRSVWSQLLDHSGDTERAAPLAEWAEERARKGSGNIIDCLPALAGVRMSQGDTHSAVALLEEFAGATGVPKAVPWAIGTPAATRIAAAAGALDLVKALQVGLDPVRVFDACAVKSGEGFIRELEGDPEAAEPAFADAAVMWRDIGEHYESACALFGRGRCLALIGRAREARSVLEEARGQFASMGARPALRQAEEALAAIL
jgi:tetratricopeptide (TPR) repeat protein